MLERAKELVALGASHFGKKKKIIREYYTKSGFHTPLTLYAVFNLEFS